MTFRIAVVQPIRHRPGEDEKNVAEAVRTIARAAEEGAHFVCFPETYPGPWRMPAMRASRDEVTSSTDFAAKQGVLGPQWQRPELYDVIYPRPLREAAE